LEENQTGRVTTNDPLWPLSPRERALVHECVVASVEGPFFRWFRFPDDDPTHRPVPGIHHPARTRIVSRERYDRMGGEWSEFSTIFGLEPSEVRDVLAVWPNFENVRNELKDNDAVIRTINNSLNNLLGYLRLPIIDPGDRGLKSRTT
jgi:hypothetical protein